MVASSLLLSLFVTCDDLIAEAITDSLQRLLHSLDLQLGCEIGQSSVTEFLLVNSLNRGADHTGRRKHLAPLTLEITRHLKFVEITRWDIKRRMFLNEGHKSIHGT